MGKVKFGMSHESRKGGSLKSCGDQETLLLEKPTSTEDDKHGGEHVLVPIWYEKITLQINRVKTKRNALAVTAGILMVVFLCWLIIALTQKPSNDVSKVTDKASMGQDIKSFQEKLMSRDSIKIVKTYVFCTACDTIRGIELQFFEVLDSNKCCLEDLSDLLKLMRLTNSKSLTQYSTKINALKSSIEDVREDTDILTKELFDSNKTNNTEGAEENIPNERIKWSMIRKNHRLLNLMLSRRRSVLYLMGTALDDGIYWSVEAESGELSFAGNEIHVNSGGQYILNTGVHFSKKICDGTEKIGYVINKEYRSGEMLQVARAREECAAGGSIDKNLRIETVLQVGLGQRLKLHLEYDKSLQPLISMNYRSHHVILYEL